MNNMSQIMKQAKAMQEKMAEMQKKIEETNFEFLQSFLGRSLEKFGNKFSRLITTIIIFDTKPGLSLSDTIKKQINLLES